MAKVQVNSATAKARAGHPPGAGKIQADKLHGPGFTKPAAKPPEKSHVVRKAATKTATKAVGVTPYGRAAKAVIRQPRAASRPKPAAILPSRDRENRTHKVTLPKIDQRTSSAGNHAPVILAEYVLAMIIIVIKTITGTAKTSYQEAMAVAMLQASALTGVFFILFLIASGKRASKVAAWFGVLIDLGVLFTAVNANSITDFTSLVQGKGLPSGNTLLSNSSPKEFYETATDWAETPASGTSAAAPTSPTSPTTPAPKNTNPPPNPGGSTGAAEWWAIVNASGRAAVEEPTRAAAQAVGTILGGPFQTQAEAQAAASGPVTPQ